MANVSSSNSHKELSPKLRFNGFNDEWRPVVLGDLIEEIKEYTSNFEVNPLFSLTIENGITPKTDRYERGFLVKKEGDTFKVVHPKNFVINPMNLRFGAIGYSKEITDISVSGYYDVFQIESGRYNDFWANYFTSTNAIKLYDSVATGSLIEKRRVHFSEFIKLTMFTPSDEEKAKIGKLLYLFETRIELQHKFVDSLKSYKRGVFSRLYDTFLANICEVKLCDIVECLDSHRIPINSSERSKRKGIYPYYGANGIQDYIDNYIFDGEFVLLAEDGGHFDEFNENAIAQYVCGKVWVNNHAHILQTTKCSTKFLYFMLEHKDIRSYINGTSRSKLNQADMMQISIPLPTEAVQTRITALLSGIDKTIIAAENTYQKLVEYKNGLLRKLFI